MAIVWTPPAGWVERNGAQVRFKAPCDCVDAGSTLIVEGGETYGLYTADGMPVGKSKCMRMFAKGVVVEALLDYTNKRAILHAPSGARHMMMATTPTELALSGEYQQLAFTSTVRVGSTDIIDAKDGGILCKVAGVVRITAQAYLEGLTDGDQVQLYIRRNGQNEGAWSRIKCAGNMATLHLSDWLQAVEAGDVITAHIRNSGSGGGSVPSGYATRLFVEYVG